HRGPPRGPRGYARPERVSRPPVHTQPVAGARDRLDGVSTERWVDLAAQMSDVDVDDVGAVFVCEVPGVLEQVQACEDLVGPAHELLEQRELLRRELDLDGAPPNAARGRIEAQVAELEHGRPLQAAPAGKGAKSSEELRERKRLDEIVVRTGVETGNAVVDRISRGEHEHGDPDTVVAEPTARLEAVDPRQH